MPTKSGDEKLEGEIWTFLRIAFADWIAFHGHKPYDCDTWNEGTKNTHELHDEFIEYQRIESLNK